MRHTLLVLNGQLVEGTPKAARGLRSLDLDEVTVAALRAHRKAKLEERMLVGAAFKDQAFVFAQPDGAPWYPDGVSQVFDCQSVSFTLDTCAHVMPGHQAEAAAAVAAVAALVDR